MIYLKLCLLAVAWLAGPVLTWADAETELRTVIDQRLQAYHKGDLDAVMTFFADGAHYVPCRADPIIGRDAIRKFYDQFFRSAVQRQIEAVSPVIRVYSDHTAVSFTSYRSTTVNVDGRTITRRKLATVTRVKRDGQWLILSEHHAALP